MSPLEISRLKQGDRIRLVLMPDDPDPVPTDTVGTVDSVCFIGGVYQCWCVNMKSWDNGRHLNPQCPPDQIERV